MCLYTDDNDNMNLQIRDKTGCSRALEGKKLFAFPLEINSFACVNGQEICMRYFIMYGVK